DDRLVSGHVGLRRQRVHRLRTGYPRHRLKCERRDACRAQRLGHRGLGQGRQEADQHRAGAEQLDLGRRRRVDLHDHVGVPGVPDRSPRSFISDIRDERAFPGPRLDDDREAQSLQPGDDRGNERYAALAWRCLSGNPHPHDRGHATISRTRAAVSVGVLPTRTTAFSSASFFAWAVPAEPEMIAPAWPMVLPSGAVNPATYPTTGLVTEAEMNAAARSSASPP